MEDISTRKERNRLSPRGEIGAKKKNGVPGFAKNKEVFTC